MSTTFSRFVEALSGRYEIERELGRGGMATVYLARDPRHQRSVALKVLDPELGAVLGADRFLSEIRVTANLQHPNLLPLFDSGEAAGQLFYVMPYVQGETLRHRLDREKQLPVDEAVRITQAIAAALDYAHRQGVIHRDLKPENVLLQDGQPLVADFGIALAVSNAAGQRMTQTGLSLGTPQYMSPEQATGERIIDARSDIYSLGAIAYEMIAGEPPHLGNSAQAVIAKLMTEEPRPLSVLRRTVPPHVDDAVLRALSKLPADRFASASQFSQALGDASRTITASVSRNAPRGISKRAFATMTVLAIAASGAALWGWIRPAQTQSAHAVRYIMGLDTTTALNGTYNRLLITPDGSRIVYTAGPAQKLYVRSRDKLESTPLSNEPSLSPALSPDGRHVAYFTGRTPHNVLKTLPLDGGAPTVMADSTSGQWGLSWGKDGYFYFGASRGGFARIMRMKATPGSPLEIVSTPDTSKGESEHLFPEVLPNGKGVLANVYYGSQGAKRAVAVVDIKTGTHRILVPALQAKYVSTGHLLYVTDERALMVVPFDQDAMRITGEPSVVAKDIALTGGIGRPADFAISATGTLVYAVTGARSESELVWVDRRGSVTPVDSVWTDYFWAPAVSPDGKRAVVSLRVGETRIEVWIKTLDRGPQLRISTAGQTNHNASWAPDGKSVLYSSDAGGTTDLWSRRADGSAPPELVLRDKGKRLVESVWSPDGKWIVYRNGNIPTLWAAMPGTNSPPIQIAPLANTVYTPTFSPDGRWLAYASNESGRGFEVVVVPFPDVTSARYVVSNGQGVEPRWSRDGKEIFYRGRNVMMSAEVRTSPTFSVVRTTKLFQFGDVFLAASPHQQYDVAPDGRFLMIRPLGRDENDQIVVVDNWFTELKSRGRQ